MKTITVKLVKSSIGKTAKVKSTLSGLGLKKVGDVSTLENTPSVRGMVKKVIYMLDLK